MTNKKGKDHYDRYGWMTNESKITLDITPNLL